jgi:hypothetical protein
MFDENIEILSYIEYSLELEKEDSLVPCMTKTDLIDMVHDVADSVRIRKAESCFMQRQLEQGFGS